LGSQQQVIDVAIVGAGATGLIAAQLLQQAGLRVMVYEQAAQPGGRLATEFHDGLQLDRGFQVLLTAYPAVKRYLDVSALYAKAFAPGANVLMPGGESTSVADPLREPSRIFQTLTSGVGSLGDKLRLLRLVGYVNGRNPEQLFELQETSTEEFLKGWGFSAQIIERFFRPFYGGIFLERRLETSQRMFLFTFKMFAEGAAVLPKGGIVAVAQQLASRLHPGSLQLQARVKSLSKSAITMEDGTSVSAKYVLDTRSAWTPPQEGATEWHSIINVYYSTPQTALPQKLISLLPGGCPVNNVAVVSGAQEAYAAKGESLISVSLFAPSGRDLDYYAHEISSSLKPWFAEEMENWTPIRHYDIPKALPQGRHVIWAEDARLWQDADGVFRAGDYRLHPSLQGAMKAGELVAEAILSKASA